MEKTTKELMEEKENYIKEMDRKIYESSQKSMRRNRELKEMRIADIKQWEEDGRPEGTFVAHQQWLLEPKPEPEPEPEPEAIIEPKEHIHKHEPIPEVIIEPEPIPEVDAEKEALKKQLELAKEKLALLQAAERMEDPEEVEIEPEIEEEVIPDAEDEK